MLNTPLPKDFFSCLYSWVNGKTQRVSLTTLSHFTINKVEKGNFFFF